jgi:hypothetical protein
MATDTDVLDRLTELEHRQSRFVLATEGNGGWTNFVEARLLEERAILTEVVAALQREFEATAKRLIGEAMAQRIRGTYARTEKYEPGDVVALDGASFMAKRASPGPCPGPDWQLVARQGARGVAGPEGKRGPSGRTIDGWIVDRSTFRVTPRLSDGSLGPPLELRALFEDDTVAR